VLLEIKPSHPLKDTCCILLTGFASVHKKIFGIPAVLVFGLRACLPCSKGGRQGITPNEGPS